jgi:serine beta-lactamase-like protein LACTB
LIRPFYIGILLVFLAAAVPAATQSEAIDAARSHVTQNLLPKAPGVSIAVGYDGIIVWSEGFGVADVAAQKPVTTNTQFRIGSVSKPLTAAGLMLLVEQGKIDLDADIHQYVPDFPHKDVVITTRELAGHLAGIRHYRGTEVYLNQHYDSVRTGLKIFEDDPLLFKPGEKYSYSSYGFNLISMVMENAAQKKFLDYMQQSVFGPLQMEGTVADDTRRQIPDRSRFYQRHSGSTNFVEAPAVDSSYKWASGGFLSTPDDLVHFGMAMLHPGLLKQSSMDAMFTSQKTSAGKSTGYGIGWIVAHDPKGRRVWYHTGGSIGGTAILEVRPDSRLVIAILWNCDEALDKVGVKLIADDFDQLLK